jgi:hypothetical protein
VVSSVRNCVKLLAISVALPLLLDEEPVVDVVLVRLDMPLVMPFSPMRHRSAGLGCAMSACRSVGPARS